VQSLLRAWWASVRGNGSALTGKTVPQTRSAIVSRSERIHEDLLARVDPELANWLKEIEVLPQVFLM
jgi:TBC1 domain family protein 5